MCYGGITDWLTFSEGRRETYDQRIQGWPWWRWRLKSSGPAQWPVFPPPVLLQGWKGWRFPERCPRLLCLLAGTWWEVWYTSKLWKSQPYDSSKWEYEKLGRPFLPPASWKAELNTSREHTKRYRSKMRSGILHRVDTTALTRCAFGRGSIIASCSARATVKKKGFEQLSRVGMCFRIGLKKYSSTAESKDYDKLNFKLNTKSRKNIQFCFKHRRRSLTKRFAKTYLFSMKSSLSVRKSLKTENATDISNDSGNW